MTGVPLSWGPDAPDMWAQLSADERSQRGEAGTDQPVIDDKHFFIRGRIEVPVNELPENFAWLVWVQVSGEDFYKMGELWTVKVARQRRRPMLAPWQTTLRSTRARLLGLAVMLHTRPVGMRPLVEVLADHQLRDEQHRGITLHRVQEIYEQLRS